MNDKSESTSVNGEWERMSNCSSESIRDDRLDMSHMIAKMAEEIRLLREENKERADEIEEKKEEITIIKQENSLLKTKIEGNGAVFTPNKWMKEEIEEMKLSNGKLSEKTMTMYKAIWEKEVSRLQSTTSSERRLLTEEIQKLEDICEKVLKNVKKVNEECIQEITKTLQNKAILKSLKKAETSHFDRFLGTYVTENKQAFWKCLELREADEKEGYEFVFTYQDGHTYISQNVDRRRPITKITIAGDNLYINGAAFTLSDQGLTYYNNLYFRA